MAKIKMIHSDELCWLNEWNVECGRKWLSHGWCYTFSKRNLRRRCVFSSTKKEKVLLFVPSIVETFQ